MTRGLKIFLCVGGRVALAELVPYVLQHVYAWCTNFAGPWRKDFMALGSTCMPVMP